MTKRAENSSKSSKRVVGRPFVKGQSGNPGGRKPLSIEAKQILSDENAEKVLKALFDTAVDRDHGDHVRAAIAFLDRKYGKPVQTLAGDPEGAPIPLAVREMTDEQLLTEAVRIAAARRKAAK